MYAIGPCNKPNDITNNNEPNDHNKPNFLGFNANTGNKKNDMVKQAIEPNKQAMKPINLSNLDKVNHSGS